MHSCTWTVEQMAHDQLAGCLHGRLHPCSHDMACQGMHSLCGYMHAWPSPSLAPAVLCNVKASQAWQDCQSCLHGPCSAVQHVHINRHGMLTGRQAYACELVYHGACAWPGVLPPPCLCCLPLVPQAAQSADFVYCLTMLQLASRSPVLRLIVEHS